MPVHYNPLEALKKIYLRTNPSPSEAPDLAVGSTALDPPNEPSGEPPVRLNDPSGKYTGAYRTQIVDDIVGGAKRYGIEPLRALAIGLQESGLGKYDATNPMQFVPQISDEQPLSEDFGFPEGAQRVENIDRALERYNIHTGRQSAKTPNDEAAIIQSYNGMGRIQGGPNYSFRDPMYGGQTDLIGARDKPYGKAILALEELLKNQPDILNRIHRN